MKIKTRSQVHCTEEKELVSDPYKFDFTVIGLNPIAQWDKNQISVRFQRRHDS